MITKNVREIDSRDAHGLHVRTLWDESQGQAFLEVVTDDGIATAEISAAEVRDALHHPAMYLDIPTKTLGESLAEINDRGLPGDRRASWLEALYRSFDSLNQGPFVRETKEDDVDDEATTHERLGRILEQFEDDLINYTEFVQEAARIYRDGMT